MPNFNVTRDQLARALSSMRKSDGGHEHDHRDGEAVSVRKANHLGHDIEVVTTYQIRVDGRTVPVKIDVDNLGRVTCHAVPNYVAVSAVEVVKQLINAYPGSFPARVEGDQQRHHPDQSHEGDHAGHALTSVASPASDTAAPGASNPTRSDPPGRKRPNKGSRK